MESEEMKECLSKINKYCIDTSCCNCKIRTWCDRNLQSKPGNWANFEPEWQTIEYDINENGLYNVGEGESIPYFDYVQGLKRLMAIHNLNASDVSFGGWYYTNFCSWHRTLMVRTDVPCKIRFYIRK